VEKARSARSSKSNADNAKSGPGAGIYRKGARRPAGKTGERGGQLFKTVLAVLKISATKGGGNAKPLALKSREASWKGVGTV